MKRVEASGGAEIPREARRVENPDLSYAVHAPGRGWIRYATAGSCAVDLGREALRLIREGDAEQAGRAARRAASWARKWLDGERHGWQAC